MTIAPVNPLRFSESPRGAEAPRAPAEAAGESFAARLDAVAVNAPIPGKGPQSGTLSDLQQFEGFVLRTFVESMLPKENTSFFGSGTAGDIWRSMMAERLGEEIAAAGGVGIAALLADSQSVAGAARAAEGAGDAQTAADASRLR